jgi:parallel beta-helix repeat protein
MKTTTARHGEMENRPFPPPVQSLKSKFLSVLTWIALLLISGAGTAGAVMLADFNDAGTWSTGWTFDNWGNGKFRTTENTYEGAGSLVVYYANSEWNEIYLNFTAQDWSNFNQLRIAAKTSDSGDTGAFTVRILGSSGTILETGRLNITSTWRGISVSLGTVDRTAVTGVKIIWHGSWASAPTHPFNFDSLEVVLDGVANVKTFGAVGDGYTDDTAALTKAANVAAGGILYFPQGTYMTAGLLLAENTKLKAAGGAVLKGLSGSGDVLTISSGCNVSGLVIDGNHAVKTDGSGIKAASVTNFIIADCKIINCKSIGISLCFSNKGRIVNNYIDTALHGIEWWGGDAATSNTPGVFDMTIANNVVKNVDGGGIWGSLGERVTVTGNTLESCGDVGIDFEGTLHSTITGNTIKNCGNGGISLFYGSKYDAICGNTVNQESGYGYAIWITSGEVNKYITISGNNLHTYNTLAIYGDQAAFDNSTIENNVIHVENGDSAVRILEGTKINLLNNRMNVAGSRGISFEGPSDSLISGNYIETSLDATGGGTNGGVYLYWRSATYPCQRNTVTNNVIKGFVTSINDCCWSDKTSYNFINGNRVSTIYRKSGTGYKGLVTNNVGVINPTTAVSATTY